MTKLTWEVFPCDKPGVFITKVAESQFLTNAEGKTFNYQIWRHEDAHDYEAQMFYPTTFTWVRVDRTDVLWEALVWCQEHLQRHSPAITEQAA